jgi:hypothetical protein
MELHEFELILVFSITGLCALVYLIVIPLLGCISQLRSTNVSTGRRASAGGTTTKNGNTNDHLSPWRIISLL